MIYLSRVYSITKKIYSLGERKLIRLCDIIISIENVLQWDVNN